MASQETIQTIRQIVANEGGGSLPDQSGNTGKFLYTDGTDTSWQDHPVPNIGEVLTAGTDAGGLGINNMGYITFNPSVTSQLYMRSPDGTPWIVQIANDGTLSIVEDT